MDWRGETLIRTARAETRPRPVKARYANWVGDAPYLAAHADGMTAIEAARHIGVSRAAINGAEARLGIRFGRDKPGRKA